MNELNKIYAAILQSWGVNLTSEHQLMLNMGGKEHPVKVDNKFVYLPTSDNMNGITMGKVFFHPACESIMSKETEIFKMIRKVAAAKLYTVFQPMAAVLFSVADKKSGKTLSGKLQELLAPFKAADKQVRTEVTDLIKGISVTLEGNGIDTRLISWTMTKGGKDEFDRHIYYTVTPTFPFYTELSRYMNQNPGAERLTFNGNNVSRQACELVITLLETAFPAILDPSTCSAYVTTSDAARLTAFLNAYCLVAAGPNGVLGKFRKEFDSLGVYQLDISWASEIDNLPELKGLVPALDYNSHQIKSSGDMAPAHNPMAGVLNTGPVNQYQPQQPLQQQGQPGQQQQPQPGFTPPLQPTPRGNETYVGVDRLDNGLFEYRYMQPNGMERVVAVSEDGRIISETHRDPRMHQQQQLINSLRGAMNFQVPMLQPQLPMNMMMPQMQPQLTPQQQMLMMANGMLPQTSLYGAGIQQQQQYNQAPQSTLYGTNQMPQMQGHEATPGMTINSL